ncbi:PREDICTED: extracellular tyrosine-protein kinase PKDCC-like [Branchiostoma belcheri]|uniref:Extracellular tyrosine-protein kinase PKDCC-like n=1 Tax=Branchiostoma belcheri TaxID=7741 RepID=A0A6P5AMK2_BRABE|nr:PREDICTED: extracellular tyrosine-protein kinase PKDCC-like [Branchiostoma belcheri]
MVRCIKCRGHVFRRPKFGVFLLFLVAFAFASVFLDCSCWKDRLLLVKEDLTFQSAKDDVTLANMLREERNRTNKPNDQPETPMEKPPNITTMGNVSDNVISPAMPQSRPMRTVEPTTDENNEFLTCKEISDISIIKGLGHGYTKVVELGSYRGQNVAVKRVQPSVKDITACRQRVDKERWHECYLFANYKIMKEILLQKQLQHPNIVKLLGYCIRSENIAQSLAEHGVVAVTEVGREFNTKEARNMPWKKRLEIALDIADLLDYFEHSPLGSLILADFKPSQFIWVGDKVKLADMDDVSSVEQACAVRSDCGKGLYMDNVTPCVDGVCRGLNAMHNIHGAYRHILQYLLVHVDKEVSYTLREEIRNLSIDAATLRSRLQQLLQLENQRLQTG